MSPLATPSAFIATSLTVAFAVLSLLHVYWACGGRLGFVETLPTRDGQRVFDPGMAITLVVAGALAAFALVAWTLGPGAGLAAGLPDAPRLAGWAVGAVLVLRAIGEFRYVGFTKRVRDTAFARYDTLLFSPFCLLAGSGYCWLAAHAA